MVQMLARVSPGRREATVQQHAAEKTVALEATVLAMECVNAGIQVDLAKAANRSTEHVLVMALARQTNALAAVRRCSLRGSQRTSSHSVPPRCTSALRAIGDGYALVLDITIPIC